MTARRAELEGFMAQVRSIAERVFKWKIRRGRASMRTTRSDGSAFVVEPAGRHAPALAVQIDSLHQVSLFIGDHALPCILVDRDTRELAALVRRHLTAIRRGQYCESWVGNGTGLAAVVEVGRGLERTLVSYNTLWTRIRQTPADWRRVRYQAY